jgi:DNA-binding MarR family transcriptional regulator
VRLTAAALAAWQRHTGMETDAEESLPALLTPAEREQLAALLRRLVLRAGG